MLRSLRGGTSRLGSLAVAATFCMTHWIGFRQRPGEKVFALTVAYTYVPQPLGFTLRSATPNAGKKPQQCACKNNNTHVVDPPEPVH